MEKNDESKGLEDTVTADSGYTILVIDDDPNAQDMMKKFLEKQKYDIIQATNG